jgi:glycosyltransferase involved in cell wall biosynthesis
MRREILTAIVPIGPNHLLENRIKLWSQEANAFSDLLKVILVQDIPLKFEFLDLLADKYKDLTNCEVISGNFGGPGAARNLGINISSTPWLCFWDSDDYPHIESVVNAVERATTEGSSVIIGAFNRSRSDVKFYAKNDLSFSHSLETVANDPGIWRMVFNKNVINQNRFENIKMAEDQIFLLDLNLTSKEIFFAPSLLYTYFTAGQDKLTMNKNALNDLDSAIHKIIQRIQKDPKVLDFFNTRIVANIFRASIRNSSLRLKIKAAGKFFYLLRKYPSNRVELVKRLLGL